MENALYSARRFFAGACFLLAAIAGTACGAEIFVSPTGSDAAAGTITAPLATLTAARDKADQLKAGNTPVTVFLRGGTYYLSAPVVFGAANSGTVTAPIRYVAYGTEIPVISGGIKVPSTAAWTVSSGQIMVTTIGTNLKVDQLFLNGKRQVLARFPNFNAGTVILDGYDANCVAASRVGLWNNPVEGPGYIRGLHASMWGGNSYIITGKNGTAITQQWVGDNNRGSGLHATYRMVENIFEELDAAGEWFYRKSTGQLFFWPPAGTNLSSATVELASQDELLRLVGAAAGTAGSVKYVQFSGVTFTHTFRTLFSKPYETVLKSDWGIARSGSIFLQNAENIVVENCLFDQVGGNGIFASGYNRNHVFHNNVFNDGGASCICLFGLPSSVRCPNSYSSTPTCSDRAPGPVDPVNGEFPAYVRVDNNMMNHFGRFEKQPAGIALSATECDTVRHNTVHDCPRAGICMCDGCWGGEVIEYNWVYNDVLETGDHGPINAWGRDRNERFGEADTTATTLDAWKQSIIRYNRFETSSNNFGIDLDDQASNYLQLSNLIMGGGLKLQWNRYNTYVNNILVNSAEVQITGLWWGSNDYVTRNIFTNGTTYWCNMYPSGSIIQDTIKNHTKLIDSNFITSNGGIGTDGNSISWAQWHAAGLDVHSVTAADPMFVNLNQTWPNYSPKGNYQVSSTSLALNVGFKNFPMDSFGVMPITYVPEYPIGVMVNAGIAGPGAVHCAVRYEAGRLFVSHEGKYRVTITSPLGRTLGNFSGKGDSFFAIRPQTMGSGIYMVSIRTVNGVVTRKLLVN
jgi:hypothetical protein